MKKFFLILCLVIGIALMAFPIIYTIYTYTTDTALAEDEVTEEVTELSVYMPAPLTYSDAASNQNSFAIISTFKFTYYVADGNWGVSIINPDNGQLDTTNSAYWDISTGFTNDWRYGSTDRLYVTTTDSANLSLYTFAVSAAVTTAPSSIVSITQCRVHYFASNCRYDISFLRADNSSGIVSFTFTPTVPFNLKSLNGWILYYNTPNTSIDTSNIFEEGKIAGRDEYIENVLPSELEQARNEGYREGERANFDPLHGLLILVDGLLEIQILPNVTIGMIFSIGFGLILIGLAIKVFLGG